MWFLFASVLAVAPVLVLAENPEEVSISTPFMAGQEAALVDLLLTLVILII